MRLLDVEVEMLPAALVPVDVRPLLVVALPLDVAEPTLGNTAMPVSRSLLCGGVGTANARVPLLVAVEDVLLLIVAGMQEAKVPAADVPAAKVVLPTLRVPTVLPALVLPVLVLPVLVLPVLVLPVLVLPALVLPALVLREAVPLPVAVPPPVTLVLPVTLSVPVLLVLPPLDAVPDRLEDDVLLLPAVADPWQAASPSAMATAGTMVR
ncbi:MAG: hypothetical protein ACR2JY_21235 [Chloroflexota bacterium]